MASNNQKSVKQIYNKRYADLKYEIKKAYRKAGISITEKQLKQILPTKELSPTAENVYELYSVTPKELYGQELDNALNQLEQFSSNALQQNDIYQASPEYRYQAQQRQLEAKERWMKMEFGTASQSISNFIDKISNYPEHGEVLKTFMDELLGEYDIDDVGMMLAEAEYSGVTVDYETMYNKDTMQRYMTDLTTYLSDRGASLSAEARSTINTALEQSWM